MEINWDAIRAEYMAGGISQRKLAEQHGVSYSVLKERAQKERWTQLREKTRQKTAAKLTDVISDAQTRKIGKLLNTLINTTETASKQLKMAQKTTKRTKTDEKTGEIVTVITEGYERQRIVDKQALRLLTQATRDLYDVVARIQGTENEAARNEVTVRFVGDDEGLAE